MIITGNRYFSLHPHRPCNHWEQFYAVWIMPEMQRNGVKMLGFADSAPVRVYINHGKWYLACPCGGIEFAWEEGLTMCLSCFNAHVNHKLLRTQFPAEREDIERILELRPLPNRNWAAGETIADLIQENRDHGMEVPDGMDNPDTAGDGIPGNSNGL